MCLIVTIVLIALSIQNLLDGAYMMGAFEALVASGFTYMLWSNIVFVMKNKGQCATSGCGISDVIGNFLKKKTK